MIRQFRDPKLVVATHNFGKLEEIRDLLSVSYTHLTLPTTPYV